MRLPITIKAALLGLALCGNTPPDPARSERARVNYDALMSGRKQPDQFTSRELRDILALAEYLRSKKDTRPSSERCVEKEIKRVGGTPSELERQVIDLKCRELGEPLR